MEELVDTNLFGPGYIGDPIGGCTVNVGDNWRNPYPFPGLDTGSLEFPNL